MSLEHFNGEPRRTLTLCGYPATEVSAYASHSLRRGSTEDLTTGGGRATLTQVLRHQQVCSGSSSSYKRHMDLHKAGSLEFLQLMGNIVESDKGTNATNGADRGGIPSHGPL
ncbi:hypothetical protein FOZ61_009131 [Perkinsus olseni]|uniref:Uncharacterized protein n=1 Tax=Perkinsus olseni TaxID=32597 RepID=A0A7J6L8J6_PEROL|nr:hypothetical protein FOZ61_009131 [Perkinsus olseni]KAF4655502.1 hypothetical protein FOL46_008217 [Perkinsus olseni]